jgi:UPF0042 nucleotide-binding protein
MNSLGSEGVNRLSTIYSFGYHWKGEDQFAVTGPCAPRIFDCRTIDNPLEDKALRRLSGLDRAVQSKVWSHPEAKRMVRQAVSYLRANPTGYVAFGCAYGKHRSVALAEMTADYLRACQTVMIVHTGSVNGHPTKPKGLKK